MKISFLHKRPDVTEQGVKIKYGAGRREARRWRWRFVVLLAASPLIYFMLSVLYDWLIIDEPGQVIMQTYEIKAPSSGTLKIMDIKAGERVLQGQQLGEIYSQELEERLALLQAQRKYLLENFPNTNDDNTSGIKRSVRATRQQVSVQADNLNRISRLLKSGAATYPEYAQARNQYESAVSELGRMEESLSTGVYIRRGLLDTEIQALEDQKNKRTLISVAAGGVITQIHAVPGQYVTQGDTLMELADPDTTVFLAYVRPKNLENIHPGQKVTIRLSDGRKISAEISSSMLMAKKLPSELQSSLESGIPKLAMPVVLNPLEPVTNIPYGAPFRVRFGFTVF